jgi:hypothetical protein
MEWIRSRPNFEKIAYVIIFSVVSYWVIELKEYPFRISITPKQVLKKYKIDKSDPLYTNDYYLKRSKDTDIFGKTLEQYINEQLMSDEELKKEQELWRQREELRKKGYYEKLERGKYLNAYNYNFELNFSPWVYWFSSLFIFSSILFYNKKDPNHPSTQDKPTTE